MAAAQSYVDSQQMPSPQALWAGLRSDWLVGFGDRDAQVNRRWVADVDRRCRLLERHGADFARRLEDGSDVFATEQRPLLLIAEPDSLDFLASFWAGLLSGWDVALANPNWGDREWAAAFQVFCPDLVWGVLGDGGDVWGWGVDGGRTAVRPYGRAVGVFVPTGGTGGVLKFTHHTWDTLCAAAAGFCRNFALPVHTYCVLPVHHVSGLMQMLRAWLSQAQVVITSFKALETGSPLIRSPAGWYISLVPTQLTRLIAADKGSWLSQFRAVLLGGAPPWPTLLGQAAEQNISLYLSYGMTETAAMVTVQKMSDSVQNHSSGIPLPHAEISIEVARRSQPPNAIGQIVVRSGAVAHGYYGVDSTAFSAQTFYTDDLGYLCDRGQLHITGRANNKIISGGENIFPAEVEAALLSTGQVKDVHVFGRPDLQWGEAVAAAFVPASCQITIKSLKAALSAGNGAPLLSRYKHPKHWIALSSIPRNAQGKLLKLALMAQIDQLSNLSNSPVADSDADCLS